MTILYIFMFEKLLGSVTVTVSPYGPMFERSWLNCTWEAVEPLGGWV